MRYGLYTICGLIGLGCLTGQIVSRMANQVCIKRFALPHVGYLIRSDVEKEVEVKVSVGSDGNVTDVSLVRGNPLIGGAVTRSLREWEFCACNRNKEVTLRFSFQTDGRPTDFWSPTRVIFSSRGEIEVFTSPAYLRR